MTAIRDRLHTGDQIWDLAADTQVGRRYQANFDVLAVDGDRPVIVVADGMGGGEGSAVAGRTAVETFLTVLSRLSVPVGPAELRDAVAQAQRRVGAAGARLGELTGCTLTALVGAGPAGGSVGSAGSAGGWLVHIGDSRAYRLRDGVLELLTSDHTEAWLGLLHGWYPADSPAAEAARYRLHRYVGHPARPEPDLLHLSPRPGDVLCLCTDGLAEQVPYQRLAQVLGAVRSGGTDPAEAVAALLADALAAGGRDNATLAILTVVAGSAP